MARKRHKPKDIEKINKAYLIKCEEFRAMTLDELRTYYQNNPKIGGSYKQALFDMVNTKLQERKEEVLNEKMKKLKQRINKKFNQKIKQLPDYLYLLAYIICTGIICWIHESNK